MVNLTDNNAEGFILLPADTKGFLVSTGNIPPTGDSYWIKNGLNIHYSEGNVGINNSNPSTNLDIIGSLKTTLDASISGLTVGKGASNNETNTACGYLSLASNTTGFRNTAIGSSSLTSNTTGDNNTACGVLSLYSNTTGSANTASGVLSLYSNTTGSTNTASGSSSLYSNTTGSANTASGSSSLTSNTTGDNNTACGVLSLYSNTTGSRNTASGRNSLYSNTTGSRNTAIGRLSLSSNTTGSFNTASGTDSLSSNTTGSNNTALGYQADLSSGNLTNCTSIGNNAICTDSNQITLGNVSVSVLRCAKQTISGLSDLRDKKDVENLESSLEFINQLKPVRFNWNMRDGGKVDIPEIGFIAQDLQQVQQDTGMKIPNLVYDVNPEKLEASYATLLPLLVKSIQELSQDNARFKKEIADLQQKMCKFV